MRMSSSSCSTRGSSPAIHKAATPQASQESTRSIRRIRPERGNAMASTRATKRISTSDVNTGTARRSRKTAW